ncbi:hypothetical protein E2C01_035448 [Portunus trituberculatus]|uniref:MADF domain-containing protein n=1 Tax=Portunus trituberculatus TaxID=210409 RepID=A0A5B7F478_PORTR|nr:hypothetical protein [Portunus trituberculatus]
MARRFFDEEDEILVEEVAKHPSLWQLSHPKYKDQQLKDNFWAQVVHKVGKPVRRYLINHLLFLLSLLKAIFSRNYTFFETLSPSDCCLVENRTGTDARSKNGTSTTIVER